MGAGGLLVGRGASGKAPQPSTAVDFRVPAHACDCHTHIFGDPKAFPFAAPRGYTPETALPAEMAAFHRAMHVERVVIVTPSVYGTDNSATLAGMKARGRNARGIAVIDEKTTDRELDAMGLAGMRGVRLNLATVGVTDPAVGRERLKWAIGRVRGRGWHIQMYANLGVVASLKQMVMDAPVAVVFDHFGGAKAAGGVGQAGFADLLDLVRAGKAYVKVSGAYRASKQGPDYSDVGALAAALIGANADRVLWGSDWPHPDTAPPKERAMGPAGPFLAIDDGRIFNQVPRWAGTEAVLRKILVENPARLYGF